MDGPNPSEMDIKVLIPALTFDLQSEYYTSINGKTIISNRNAKKFKNRFKARK